MARVGKVVFKGQTVALVQLQNAHQLELMKTSVHFKTMAVLAKSFPNLDNSRKRDHSQMDSSAAQAALLD